jgi:hypothetical protein
MSSQLTSAQIARFAAMREMTREEEAQWLMPPFGPRAEIGAIVDGDHIIYTDGQGNPLEPGWVLAILRGGEIPPPGPRTVIGAMQHPWMRPLAQQPGSQKLGKA